MTEGYPFVLEKKDLRGADELMEYTLQYQFESQKWPFVPVYVGKQEKYTFSARIRQENKQFSWKPPLIPENN